MAICSEASATTTHAMGWRGGDSRGRAISWSGPRNASIACNASISVRSSAPPTLARSAGQSIGVRSTNASIAETIPRSSVEAHRFRQAADSAVKGHACGIAAAADHQSKLVVRVIELDVGDNQGAIGGAQSVERSTIPGLELIVDGKVERGRALVPQIGRQRIGDSSPRQPPVLVTNPIADGFGQICGQRAIAVAFDRAGAAQRSHHDVMHDVGGVGDRPHPTRKSAVGEAVEAGEARDQQRVERTIGGRKGVERGCGRIGRRGVRRHLHAIVARRSTIYMLLERLSYNL
jgi:hypothetical protein